MKELATSLLQALKLEEKLSGEKRQTPELEQQIRLWGAGIFRLIVMGEIKKGKSSFINAMLGVENLVPVSSDVATSTIFKIRYAKERGYRVHFTAESGKGVLDIRETELARYGTEDGNPGNVEQVDYIEVMCSSPLLKTGIVIIDTPGLGGLFKEHKKITYQYVPRADAVFFVTDSVESPIGELELEYLRDIRAITPHLYFVQTKSCAVDSEAANTRKKNNLSILSKALEMPTEKIPYFTVDSHLYFEALKYKDAEDLNACGYPRLKAFIQHVLQSEQRKMLVDRSVTRITPTLANLQDMVHSRRQLLLADTEEKRSKREADIDRTQRELAQWEETERPKLLKSFQDEMKQIRRDAEDLCRELAPGGKVQTDFDEMIHSCEDRETLAQLMGEMNTKLPEHASRVHQEIAGMVQHRAEEILSRMGSCSSDLSAYAAPDNLAINTNGIERAIGNIQNQDSLLSFNTMRTGFYGGSVGTSITSVVGALIGSVVPGIGTIIGSGAGALIGMLWGGMKAVSSKKEQELRVSKNECRNALSQSIAHTYSLVQRNLNRLLEDISSCTNNAIADFIRTKKNELDKQREEIRRRDKMENDELNLRMKKLREAEMIVARIDKVIKSYRA